MGAISFFVGALLPGTGADRGRITSRTTQTKRRKVATIRGDISRTLNNAPTHYSASPNFHCSRVIKRTSSRSNHPIVKWTAQLGIRCDSDKRVCPSPSRWSRKPIQKELGKSHTGQLGFTDSPRTKVRVFHSTTLSSDRATEARCREITGTIQGSKQTLPKVSNYSNNQRWSWVCQSSYCYTQNRGEVASSDKSQSVECLHGSPTLQDGVGQIGKRFDTERRLADKTRSRRYLLDSASAPLPSEISLILLARPNVAICSPPIWSKQCSIYIHKINEASGGNSEEVRDPSSFISGRYAHNGKLSKQGQRSLSMGNLPLNVSQIYSKYGEKYVVSKTTDRVFRLQVGFQDNGYFTASTETDNLVENNKTSSREDTGIIERNIPGSGNNGSDTSSHLTSPTTLQTPGEDQNTLPQSWLCFRQPSPTQQGHPVRLEVVDSRGQLLQWSALTNNTLGFDHRIRCIQTRLQCQLPRDKHRGTMDTYRAVGTYKLFGNESSLSGITILLHRKIISIITPSHGQCHSDCISEQDGRQPFQLSIGPSQGSLDVVHQKENNHSCRTPTRVR